MHNLKHPLILGSQSPRRKQILKDAGFEFTCLSPDVEETYPEHLKEAGIPVYLAEKKAQKVIEMMDEPSIILTSDTIVWHRESALNKPQNELEAIDMLISLSDSAHYVHTGVCVLFENEKISFSETTEVKFQKLSSEIINYYVNKFKPLDKAGAYGIQEWIGMIGVEKINGSFYNVMGLPIHRVFSVLMKFCQ
ncbi:MAG: Maf family nucleotide pyrophosphatase [Cytophagales bacterium]